MKSSKRLRRWMKRRPSNQETVPSHSAAARNSSQTVAVVMRSEVGCFGIVAGRGRGSTLPIFGRGQCPDQRFQAAAVGVILPVMADLPNGGQGVGDAGDALHTVGCQLDHRFGDEHRRGVG